MYDPELYALVHRGTDGDAEFYAGHARGRRVLELGAGYGRLIPALSASATRYVGVELDPGLLGLASAAVAGLPEAQRARTTLLRADMRELALRERFDRILIPHSGLWCLESDADVEHVLARVREHLAPGGELILDAYHADPFHEHSDPADVADDHEEQVAEVEHAGTHYRVMERSTWDRDQRRMEVVYRHVPEAGGDALEGTIRHRYLLCDELATILVGAGFEELAFAGDFGGTPLDDDHELMVIRARLRQAEAGAEG